MRNKLNFIKDDIKETNFTIDYIKTIDKLKYTKDFIDNLTVGSDFKLYFKCKLCNTTIENPIRYRDLIDNKGHIRRCDFCGDKISIGEKFIGILLKELNIDYIKELGKTTFDWCNNYKYDFYFEFNNESYIIETHGEQHYRDIGKGRSLEEEQLNDKIKKEIALKNNINNYIVLDCRKDENIKNNILNSNLIKIIKEKNICWEEIYHKCFQPILFEVCKQWNEKGNTRENLLNICDNFKISEFKARKLLKTGESINICKYDSKLLIKQRGEKISKINKTNLYKCYLNKEVKYFRSFSEISKYYKITNSIIRTILRKKEPYKIYSKNYYEKYKHIEGLCIEKIENKTTLND